MENKKNRDKPGDKNRRSKDSDEIQNDKEKDRSVRYNYVNQLAENILKENQLNEQAYIQLLELSLLCSHLMSLGHSEDNAVRIATKLFLTARAFNQEFQKQQSQNKTGDNGEN